MEWQHAQPHTHNHTRAHTQKHYHASLHFRHMGECFSSPTFDLVFVPVSANHNIICLPAGAVAVCGQRVAAIVVVVAAAAAASAVTTRRWWLEEASRPESSREQEHEEEEEEEGQRQGACNVVPACFGLSSCFRVLACHVICGIIAFALFWTRIFCSIIEGSGHAKARLR